MDDMLCKMQDGLLPDLIPFKVKEYREEFEALKIEYAEENGIDIEDEEEMDAIDETCFRAFVCHKLAAFDTVLTKIVSVLNGVEDED